MRAKCWLPGVAIVGLTLVGASAAQQTIPWQPNLESARTLAAQSDRLILMHFWSEACSPCVRMDREVFSDVRVASELTRYYVPVRIDVRQAPKLAQQYGVTAYPTDVVVTADGREIGRSVGFLPRTDYLGRLSRIAYDARFRAAGPTAQIPSRSAPGGQDPAIWFGAHEQVEPGAFSPALPPSLRGAQHSGEPLRERQPPVREEAAYGSSGGSLLQQNPFAPQGHVNPPAGSPPAGDPPAISIPPGNPPLAMDGFCPVQIYEKNHWVRGNPRYGVIHRGRTYLFQGPEEAKRFYADPDRYAPVLSGQDVVLAVDQGLSVPGTRAVGVSYDGHIYLFSSEASCQKFYQDPERYAGAVQGMIGTAQRAVPGAKASSGSSASSPPSSSRAWDGRY